MEIVLGEPKASEIKAYMGSHPKWRLCGCSAVAETHYHVVWAPYGKGGFAIQPDKPVKAV